MSQIGQIKIVSPAEAEADVWAVSEAKSSVPLPGALAFALVGLFLAPVATGIWWHSRVTASLAANSGRPLAALEQWPVLLILVSIASGGLLAGLVALVFRRAHTHLEQKTRIKLQRSERTVGELRGQLNVSETTGRSVREHHVFLSSRMAVLTQQHEEVLSELNRLKQAQHVSSHKQQELARSKGVLELHVQARAEQVQKLQREYELILNSAGEGICSLSIDGRVTFANPAAARMMGGPATELVGRPAREVFASFMADSSTGSTPGLAQQPCEAEVARLDGTRFGAEYVRTPIREGERVTGEVLLFKDITERKEAQETLARKAEELARSNAELEQFAFVASHDLQEPLRKIQAFGDRLKMKCAAVNLDEGREYLDRMQSAAARMQTLIFDLLTFSRVIRRTEPFAAVDLKAVMVGVVSDLETLIEKSGGRVEIGELPAIEADATQMHQLLLNLTGNALKFHAPGQAPLVRVQSRLLPPDAVAGQMCELTVSDNGIGFDEKYLDRIFAVFQRLHGRQEYEGTGIGLAVCRRIAERHGGTITARSQPGQGATFVVMLPVRQEGKMKGSA